MTKKHTLASIDKHIADLIALIAFYETLHLALIALGDAPMPKGHAHLLEVLRAEGATTFKRDASKTIIKEVASIVDCKKEKGKVKGKENDNGKGAARADLKAAILRELQNTKSAFDTAVAARHIMCKSVVDAQVKAIVKNAQKQPTVAKARSTVRKVAASHGLLGEEQIQDYLD